MHHANVAAVEGKYKHILTRIDGNRGREEVYSTISNTLSRVSV